MGQVRDAAAAALGRRLESRAVRGGADPHRAATCRRAVARGVRRRASLAPARPGGGRASVSRRRLRFGDGLHVSLARVLQTAGGSEQALPLLDEARQRFEAIAQAQPGRGAERMASVCFAERGDCLLDLGRLDEAAAAYEEAIRRARATR
ncbi:MAG: hypothetical protein V9G98_19075 [Candidatus Competibacter sp.]